MFGCKRTIYSKTILKTNNYYVSSFNNKNGIASSWLYTDLR
jgi:hypothetical protein